MQPRKKKPSIRDFFSPAPKNASSAVNTTLSPSNTNNPTPQADIRSSSRSNVATPDAASTSLSTSTLSSAPSAMRATSADTPPFNTSQTSANSGATRRITSNGQQVVLDSDDSDSLPDLDFGELLPRPKPNPKPRLSTTVTTRSKRLSDDEDEGLFRPVKKQKSGNRALKKLVETAQKNLETERTIEEHKAALNEALEEPVTARSTIDEAMLGQVIQDDEDDPGKAHRLFQAMQRTNAIQTESTFYFFDDTSDSISVRTKFPINSLPSHRWAGNFRDPKTRDQAFLTGFAQQIFRIQELPEEISSWMIDQICSCQNETLNTRYIEILESRHEHLTALLDRKRLDTIFMSIGANREQLRTDHELNLTSEAQSAIKPLLPRPLKSILKLLQRAAPWLRTKARSYAFYILCHVCLDGRVIANTDILSTAQDAMEAMMCNFADNHKLISGVRSSQPPQDVQSLITSQLSEIIPELLAKISDPMLQKTLICALPTRSPLTAYLQRHLALSFLVYPAVIDIPLADPKLPSIIHEHLDKSPTLRLTKSTDYGQLAARLVLLDIAIGPGPFTVPYQPLTSPPTSQTDSSPVRAPFPESSDVKNFNKEVDTLAHHVKLLGNSIVEAGAVVDLSIFDAKDNMERLCARLEHAVRIGGKKVHNVFGNDDEVDKQPSVNKYFKKTPKDTCPPSRSIFDDDDHAAVEIDEATENLESG